MGKVKKKYTRANEPENKKGMRCSICGKRKLSVSNRPDGYAQDVGNDLKARYTVCDECDYQCCMDI